MYVQMRRLHCLTLTGIRFHLTMIKIKIIKEFVHIAVNGSAQWRPGESSVQNPVAMMCLPFQCQSSILRLKMHNILHTISGI